MPANNPFEAVRDHVAPRPPPTEAIDRVVYGLTQPLLGARMLATHRPLFEAALVPVALLAVFCAVVALISDGDGGFFHRFYTTFAVLAPLPSIVFASHYARLAVQARHAFGFSHVEPCIEPLSRVLKRAVKQAILIGLALAPFTALLHAVPGGWLLVKASAAVWALHWVVVDAFDSARVLRPGETLADLDAAAQRIRPPWFVRWLLHAADAVPIGGRLVRWFARLCDRLSLPWREEIALVEEHPAMMLGFALSTAVALAVPILNLAFRPIVIIGASHVLGQLEAAGRAEHPMADPHVAR